MKRFMILFLIGLCTVLSYAQDFKPCGTAMLAKRHKAQSSITRQSSQEEIRHYEGDKNGLIILEEWPDYSCGVSGHIFCLGRSHSGVD